MHAKMNVSSRLSLANDSSQEETDDWNSTGTTPIPWTSESEPMDLTECVTGIIQWILFTVGTAGNLTVLVVLLWRRSKSQVGTQMFVGSLAFADIGMMLSSTWVEAYDSVVGGFPFGSVACKIQYFWQRMTMNASIWTLAVLSIDRFLGIKKIGGNGLKAGVAAAIVVGIWIYNAMFNSPLFIWSDLFEGRSGELSCYSNSDIAYVLAARIINFYVPLTITWTSNVGIIYRLRSSMSKVGGQGGAGTSATSGSSAQHHASRKVTRMCLIIASTFTVTWVPYQVTQIVILAVGRYRTKAVLIIDPVETMTYFNSCINPVVYALMWRPFRLSLIQMMDSIRKCVCGKKGTVSASATGPTGARAT